MRKIERNKSDRLFTFFDFLYKGYYSFQSDLEATFKEANVNTDKNEESLIKIHQNLREDIIEFINEIYETIDDADIDGYIGYVLFGFVQKFLSECDARFTLRRLDSSQNKMVAIFSTREDIHPGDIDLRKKNLISLSLNLNKPVIYSENMKNHYKTSNNSIHKGKYEDYVSFCLLKTVDNKPFYSICLDVKGENAKKRMKAFVDSLVFDVICSAIALKFIKSAQDEKLEEN
ncbi:hypothetical protein [uncultured Acetobacteroides sp.]|uniref:hypothetical protein n=1 Tax=uncultured Acetobacteroides sp. TaxID=1760811 RepID=UPI0037495B47